MLAEANSHVEKQRASYTNIGPTEIDNYAIDGTLCVLDRLNSQLGHLSHAPPAMGKIMNERATFWGCASTAPRVLGPFSSANDFPPHGMRDAHERRTAVRSPPPCRHMWVFPLTAMRRKERDFLFCFKNLNVTNTFIVIFSQYY